MKELSQPSSSPMIFASHAQMQTSPQGDRTESDKRMAHDHGVVGQGSIVDLPAALGRNLKAQQRRRRFP